jgi:hypothetical protein
MRLRSWWLFVGFALALAIASAHCQTVSVRNFPGSSVGDKLTQAQNLGCSPDTNVTCVLVIEPELNVFPVGTPPAKCSRCTWLDYRTPGSNGLSSDVAFVYATNFSGVSVTAKLDAAAASCGGNGCVIIIPPSMTIGCPSAATAKVTFWDFRANGAQNCIQNVVAWTVDDGNVNAFTKDQYSVTNIAPTGSAVNKWFQQYCHDGAFVNAWCEGMSAETVITGDLTGTTSLNTTGNEQVSFILSTNGAITLALGGQGYVTDVGSRTTSIAEVRGLDGIGCSNITGTPQPLRCFGLYGRTQRNGTFPGGQASSRNYSIGLEGRGLLKYDANEGAAGLRMEDTAGADHDFIAQSSTHRTIMQAVETGGLYLSSSDGRPQFHVDSAGAFAGAGHRADGTVVQNEAAIWNATGCGGGGCFVAATNTDQAKLLHAVAQIIDNTTGVTTDQCGPHASYSKCVYFFGPGDQAVLDFDGTPTVSDYVTLSTTTAPKFHTGGASPVASVWNIGKVALVGGASTGTVNIVDGWVPTTASAGFIRSAHKNSSTGDLVGGAGGCTAPCTFATTDTGITANKLTALSTIDIWVQGSANNTSGSTNQTNYNVKVDDGTNSITLAWSGSIGLTTATSRIPWSVRALVTCGTGDANMRGVMTGSTGSSIVTVTDANSVSEPRTLDCTKALTISVIENTNLAANVSSGLESLYVRAEP